jgi:arylsulfatase A
MLKNIVLLVFLCVVFCLHTTLVYADRLPNIVLIMADDLGYGGIGCYGQTKVATPNLDQLANRGMRFTQAYAGCCMCAPSRCVLLTGLHTGHCRVRANDPKQRLTPMDVTFVEILQKAGYTTAGFGKWGLGDAETTGEPYRHGFGNWVGYLDQADAHFHYPDWIWKDRAKFFLAGNRHEKSERHTYAPDVIHDAAIEFIRTNKDSPFFCFLATTIPHAELLVPPDSLAAYDGRFSENPYVGDRYSSNEKPRATYAAMVTRMDRDIGRLVKLLKDLDLEKDTLVLFTSDNGPINAGGADPDFFQNGGGLRGWKFSLYEGGIRVPFIASWPGKIQAGTINESVVSHEDIFPTFCEIAKVAIPKNLDGASLLLTMTGSHQPKVKERLYWESPSKDGLMQAIRYGNLKGIRPKANAPFEFYDLKADPSESHNLAEKQPEIASRLENEMASLRTELVP